MKQYTFIGREVSELKVKQLQSPQGVALINTFVVPLGTNEKVTMTKPEILQALSLSGYRKATRSFTRVWENFLWYRQYMKLEGLMA